MRKRKRRYWWVERGVYGTLRDDVVTMWRIGFTGSPIDCRTFKALGRTGRELLRACEEMAESMLERPKDRRVAGNVAAKVHDEEWSILWQNLHAHLTETTWADGAPRQTSTLTVFVDGGTVKGLLKDRDAGLCLWGASPTINGLFSVLEALLCDPTAEWRLDRQSGGGKASRVKR